MVFQARLSAPCTLRCPPSWLMHRADLFLQIRQTDGFCGFLLCGAHCFGAGPRATVLSVWLMCSGSFFLHIQEQAPSAHAHGCGATVAPRASPASPCPSGGLLCVHAVLPLFF